MGGKASAPASPQPSPAVPPTPGANGISYVQRTDWPAPSSDEGALLAAAPSSYQLAYRLLLFDLKSPRFPAKLSACAALLPALQVSSEAAGQSVDQIGQTLNIFRDQMPSALDDEQHRFEAPLMQVFVARSASEMQPHL